MPGIVTVIDESFAYLLGADSVPHYALRNPNDFPLTTEWFDVRRFMDFEIVLDVLTLTGGGGPTFRAWVQATDDDHDSQIDPDLWTAFDLPYDVLEDFTAPMTAADVPIFATGHRNIMDISSAPWRTRSKFSHVPAHYIRLRFAFSGSFTSTQGATILATFRGK